MPSRWNSSIVASLCSFEGLGGFLAALPFFVPDFGPFATYRSFSSH